MTGCSGVTSTVAWLTSIVSIVSACLLNSPTTRRRAGSPDSTSWAHTSSPISMSSIGLPPPATATSVPAGKQLQSGFMPLPTRLILSLDCR